MYNATPKTVYHLVMQYYLWHEQLLSYPQDLLVTPGPERRTESRVPRRHRYRVSPGGAAAEQARQDGCGVKGVVPHDVVTLCGERKKH